MSCWHSSFSQHAKACPVCSVAQNGPHTFGLHYCVVVEFSETGDDQRDEEAQLRGVYQIPEIADDIGCPLMFEQTVGFVDQDDEAHVAESSTALVPDSPELFAELSVWIAATGRGKDHSESPIASEATRRWMRRSG